MSKIKTPEVVPGFPVPPFDAKEFFKGLTVSLVTHLFAPMGSVRTAKVERFMSRLADIADWYREMEYQMRVLRDSANVMRMSRVKAGRGRKKIEHSLKYLQQAEALASNMEEIKSGFLDFKPARKGLENLEKRFLALETTSAALIPQNLRTRREDGLAPQTPHRLTLPEFDATPKSSQVMHRTVELLDDEIGKFTGGKVPPHNINQFIVEFIGLLGYKVEIDNVKTIRSRDTLHPNKLPPGR